MMSIRINYFLRLLVFWLLFFAMFRMWFILYHHAKIPDGHHSETSLSFIYALPLDIAISALLAIVPYILWTFQQFHKSRLIHMINLGYHGVLISFLSVISIFNIKLYGEHERLLSTEELAYLLYPGEAITFLSVWSLLLMLIASAFFAFISIKAYRRYITNFSYPVENKNLQKALVVIIPLCLVLGWYSGTRGGKGIPSHYSQIKINNDIATNTFWYLGHSFCAGNESK
jgi:hypothetical protein